jgi:hypothetical protein
LGSRFFHAMVKEIEGCRYIPACAVAQHGALADPASQAHDENATCRLCKLRVLCSLY